MKRELLKLLPQKRWGNFWDSSQAHD